MFKQINIGNLKIKGNLFLAPMSGVTNIAFRTLCRRYGADLCFTEFVNSHSILNMNLEENKRLKTDDLDKPLGIQIFGNDEESLGKAAKEIEPLADLIDMNLGCPAYRIIRTGCGSELLKEPEKLKKIIEKIVDSVDKPISVKIRSGIDEKTINAVEVAKLCENSGVKMITVHARTQKQGYSGKIDLEVIKKVKEAVNIPVIGNGDVISFDTAKELIEKTGCDGIMIGRGARTNPSIFNEIKNGEVKDKLELLYEYIQLCKDYNLSLKDLKIPAMGIIHGFNGALKLREELSNMKSYEEIESLI